MCSRYEKIYEPRHLVCVNSLSITIHPTIIYVIVVLQLLGPVHPTLMSALKILPRTHANDFTCIDDLVKCMLQII